MARIDFGMSKAEFMALNLRQWEAMRKRCDERQQRADSMVEVMVAQLIAVVGNSSFRGYKETLKPHDFMPSRHKAEAETQPRRKRQSRQVIADGLRAKMLAICKG